MNNGQRSLEYLTGITAALLVVRRGRLSLWLGGLALGAGGVAVYSLATRLYPDRFGAFNAAADYRLFVPIGYWNALGIFAAIGALIAFGVAVAGRGRVLRVLTAIALVPLTSTLYFTFSRGATLALGFGLLAVFALSPQRLRLLGGLVRPRADTGSRRAARVPGAGTDAPVGRRERRRARRAPARARARTASGCAGRRCGGLRRLAVTGERGGDDEA